MSTMVHGRVDDEVKAKATEALEAMGLTVSDAVRVFLKRVAAEQAIPFEIRVPNAESKAAIHQLEAGEGEPFASVDALMADLHEDD